MLAWIDEAARLRAGGATLEQIGAKVGKTRQRVSRTLRDLGVEAVAPRAVSDDDLSRIISMYCAGIPMSEVSELTGLSYTQVRYHTVKHMGQRTRHRPRITPGQTAKAVALRARGKSCREVARRLGVSAPTVSLAVAKAKAAAAIAAIRQAA